MDLGNTSIVFVMLGLAVAALGVAIGQGITVKSALEGMARQPDVAGRISNSMIVGLAFIESIIIYVLVIGLIVFFADPFAKPYSQMEEAEAKLGVAKMELERIQVEAQTAELKLKLGLAASNDVNAATNKSLP